MNDLSANDQATLDQSGRFYNGGVAPDQIDQTLDAGRPAMEGFGREVGLGALRAFPEGAKAIANLGVGLGGAFAKGIFTPNALERRVDASQDALYSAINAPSTFQKSIDAYTPDAHTTGKAAQWFGRTAELPGQLIMAGGNPEVMALESSMESGQSAVDQGAGGPASIGIGVLSGLATEAGMRIPVVGSTLATRVASGAAGFTAANTAATLAQREIAAGSDNPALAAQYDPWDEGAFLSNVLSGALFGGVHHFVGEGFHEDLNKSLEGDMKRFTTLTPSEQDAALTLNNAKNFQSDTMPGTPLNAAAVAGHADAMEQAMEQANAGQSVAVTDKLQGAEFAPRESFLTEQERAEDAADAQMRAQVTGGEPLERKGVLTEAEQAEDKADADMRSRVAAFTEDRKGADARRDADQAERVGALSDEQAQAGAKSVSVPESEQPREGILRQSPQDIETALSAAKAESGAKPVEMEPDTAAAMDQVSRIAAVAPEHPVMGENGLPTTAAEEHQSIMDEHEQAVKDSQAYETAIQCYMGNGA